MSAADVSPFQPSHTAPDRGMAAWEQPDATRPAVAQLDPWLPVRVREQSGAWSRVECANGWSAWVDGRLLMPVQRTVPTTARPLQDLKRMPAATVTPMALAGAALVLLGSVLPWWTLGGSHSNAWDIPIGPLLRGTGTDAGLKTGVLLLVVVLVGLPLLLQRPVSGWVNAAVGAVACNLAVCGVITALRFDPHLGIGIGLVLTFVGGASLIGERVAALYRLTKS